MGNLWVMEGLRVPGGQGLEVGGVGCRGGRI